MLKNDPKTEKRSVVALSHPVNPGKFSEFNFCFKLSYVSKSYTLESVDRGLKKNSFHSLLTPVISEIYALIA